MSLCLSVCPNLGKLLLNLGAYKGLCTGHEQLYYCYMQCWPVLTAWLTIVFKAVSMCAAQGMLTTGHL